MRTIKIVKEEIGTKEARFEALTGFAASRTLTTEESTELSTLDGELAALDAELKSLESIEARKLKIAGRKAAAAKGPEQDNAAEDKDWAIAARNYRFAKAFKKIAARKPIDGLEKEMYEEAGKEIGSEEDVNLQGNVAIPSRLIMIGDKNAPHNRLMHQEMQSRAALNVGTEGTDVVFTDYGGLIPTLNPTPAVIGMGVNVLTGLRGNVQWPRHTTDVAFSWETETSDVDETTPAFDNVSISPKRVGGYTDVTMQMLKQSVFVLEPWLRGILERRYNLTVDYAILNGSGTGNEPTGIFNASGVGVFSTGSGGASNNLPYAGILAMMRDARVAKTRVGSQGWMMNANGEFCLANTPKQTNGVEGNFILSTDEMKNKTLVGRKYVSSEVIKSDFSEGSQTDLCGLVYSDNWGGAIFGTWGGMDILFDPFTQAVGGKVRFVVNCFMDTDIEQPAEFQICKDWDATDLPAAT